VVGHRRHLAKQWDQQRRGDKGEHDRTKCVGKRQGRGLAIGERPELLQRGDVPGVEIARHRGED
jgi:hypothetical protein